MKILVCVSKTPETTAKIGFKDNNTEFDENGVQFIMNPYDEWYALVRALELKEKEGGTVTVLNVGAAANDIIIRKGLALGADNGVRIDVEPTSAFETASHIASYAQGQGYDVIFTGKETISYNGSEVGAMVAELMDMPYVSYASHMDYAGGTFTVSRDVEGGIEVCEVNGACVISGAKGLAKQRIANMMGIMQSKRKPIDVVAPAGGTGRVKVAAYELPQAKSGVKMIDPENMDELVRLLHEEAKVI